MKDIEDKIYKLTVKKWRYKETHIGINNSRYIFTHRFGFLKINKIQVSCSKRPSRQSIIDYHLFINGNEVDFNYTFKKSIYNELKKIKNNESNEKSISLKENLINKIRNARH